MKKEQLLYEMIWFIQNKKEFTAQELADRFQLSVRSVYRYITDLADLGLYVESKKGRNGGFTVLANQVLPPVLFTEDEITALYFAIQSLKNYPSFPFQVKTITAAEKLLAVVPRKLKDKLLHLEDHFQLATPAQIVENPFLNQLMEAVMNRTRIQLSYQSPKQKSVRLLEPLGIYASNGLWYLLAVKPEGGESRHYRIDRILALDVLSTPVESQLTLAELDKEYKPQEPLEMKVLLTEAGVKQCRENRYLYASIKKTEQGGILQMKIDKRDIPYTGNYLLLLGIEAKVEQPQELVNHLRDKTAQLQAMYGKE